LYLHVEYNALQNLAIIMICFFERGATIIYNIDKLQIVTNGNNPHPRNVWDELVSISMFGGYL
jgi:hypothetical protein